MIATDGEALGVVAFTRGSFEPGDLIPQGPASLRVTAVIEPEHDGELPLLVVWGLPP